MAENIDLTDKRFITRVISEIYSSERRTRQINHLKAYKVYKGAVDEFVQEKLEYMRPKSWKQYTRSDISISAMVVNKIAKSYNDSPARSVEGDDNKTKSYDEIFEKTQGDRYFQEFDQIFNLQREALFWVYYRPQEQRIQFQALAPYEYSVIRNKDNGGELQVVVLHYPSSRLVGRSASGDGKADIIAESQDDSSADRDTYVFWSATQHVAVEVKREKVISEGREQVKVNIDFVPIENNPNNVNPIGRLPFAYLSKDMAVDNPYLNPITDQTITFNLLWSELLTAANIQGVGQFILKYPEKFQGSLDKLSYGLTTALELPQSSNPDDAATDATYINPSPDLAGQMESYMAYLKQILSQHGINSTQAISGDMSSFSSGLERMIAMADVQDLRMQNQNLYSSLEKEVFEIVKAWDQNEAIATGRGRLFDDDDTLQVYYPKPKVMISDAETLANIEKRLDLGLMEKHEALMLLDPNLSEEEAKEKLARIDETRNENVEGFLNGRQGDDNSESGPDEGSERGSQES